MSGDELRKLIRDEAEDHTAIGNDFDADHFADCVLAAIAAKGLVIGEVVEGSEFPGIALVRVVTE